MGNFFGSEPTHTVKVKTGEKKGAGCDANIFVQIGDSTNKFNKERVADNLFRDDFEKGEINIFQLSFPGVTKVTELSIRRDETGADDSWYVETVTVQHKASKTKTLFPVHRWINANNKIVLSEFDSCLPEDDKRPEQRAKELEKKRLLYELEEKVPGLPRQAKEVPEDEVFTEEYQKYIDTTMKRLGYESHLTKLFTGPIKGLLDFEDVYIGGKLGGKFYHPLGYYKWRSDAEFGQQRLSGTNPIQLQRCQSIPDGFAVTSEMVEPFLEGDTLQMAMNSRKIYLVDHTDLVDLECLDQRKICAPYALFYMTKTEDLIPIAIQLEPKAAEDNPVFLPSDPEYTWLLAKLWFNLADSSVHQSASHLGFTHMLMETAVVVANRQLSPSHPIYRLLAPHFYHLIAINRVAVGKLVAPGGLVDQSMAIGHVGMFNIIRRRLKEYNLLQDGHLPNFLKSRGTDDDDALPNYHYRDDALLYWDAIKKYVEGVVYKVYDTEEKLQKDREIQEFAAELSSPDHGNLKGMPSEFGNREQLRDVLTIFIFTCSVQHGAVNYGQYDEYGFIPNYPAILNEERPKSKEAKTENDVIKSLPNKTQTLMAMVITALLSSKATNSLGNFEIQYGFDPVAKEALDKFREDLKVIAGTIELRNLNRLRKYDYLHPDEVPNSISI